MTNNSFPLIDSLEKITQHQLERLQKEGFCYIKINEAVESKLLKLSKTAREFFDEPEGKKQEYPFSDELGGYVNYGEKRGVNIQH